MLKNSKKNYTVEFKQKVVGQVEAEGMHPVQVAQFDGWETDAAELPSGRS